MATSASQTTAPGPASASSPGSAAGSSPGQGPAPSLSAPAASPRISPRRADRLMMWLILTGIALLVLPPTLIELRHTDVTVAAEADAIRTSEETWRRQAEMSGAGWTSDLLVPMRNGMGQLTQPPGTTWMHLVLLRTLDPADATRGQIAYRARLVSVLGALVMILGVYWAGYAIGGLSTGSFAALALVANPVVIYFARLGTPHIAGAAFVVLAIATSLWAIRPRRRPPTLTRQFIGHLISGVALGAATLTMGPVALPLVILPLLLAVLLCDHRASHLLSLFAVFTVAMLIVMPWALFVHSQDPSVWFEWGRRMMPTAWYDPGGYVETAGQRALWGALATLPWTLWLICAVLQPFSTSSSGVRSRMFIGWSWFMVTAVVLLAMPGERGLGDLLPLLAAASVLVGQLFRQLADLSAEGRHARVWRLSRWPTLITFLLLSLTLPALMLSQQGMIDHGWIQTRMTAPSHIAYDIAVGIALLAVAIIGARYAVQHYPGKALAAWAVWTVILLSGLAQPVSQGPWMRSGAHAEPRQQILPRADAAVADHMPSTDGAPHA